MATYLINFDGDVDVVEGSSISDAVAIWAEHMRQVEEVATWDDEPESVQKVSDRDVVRRS